MRVIPALALVAVLVPMTAAAQSSAVTVLLPERFQVEEQVAQLLYDALVAAVDAHPDYQMAELPPATLTDVLLAVGCSEANPECLSYVAEIVGTPYMIWGEVGGTDGAYLVELTLWDFAAGAARYRFTKAVQGDVEEFQAAIPVFARGLVFGPVGRIEIRITPPDAAIEFDSRPAGAARPLVIEDLELGPHVIRATAPGFFDHRETVIVDIQGAVVEIALRPTVEEIEVTGGKLWTWIAIGSGVALTGAGVAFALLEQGTQDDFDTEAGRPQVNEEELQTLQDDGELQALLANIFFAAGGAALVAGVILFFVEEEEQVPVSGSDTDVSVRPHFGADGYGFSLDIAF